MKRPTISDIAQRAGVSKSAVSFALNNRPGVSDHTRARIFAYAEALGWYPNSAARSLSAAKADLVGLVLARKPSVMAVEPFFMELVSGIEGELGTSEVGLVLKVVGEDLDREIDIYRRWAAQRRVDGVFIADVRTADPRIAECERLGLPAVVLSRRVAAESQRRMPFLSVDVRSAVVALVDHLVGLGHRDIARVAGPASMVHTGDRDRAFVTAARRYGLPEIARLRSDYTAEQGERATRALLDAQRPPTAIVYDNDIMAVRAIVVARQLGLRVPDQLTIISWENSMLCDLPQPTVTSLHLDVVGLGAMAAGMLARHIGGAEVADHAFPTSGIVVRGSSGPAR
jgi:DNA-binding LacI/PurR family transcriptional regulator